MLKLVETTMFCLFLCPVDRKNRGIRLMMCRCVVDVNIITDDQVELTPDVYFSQKCRRLKTTGRKQAAVSKLHTG